MSLIRFREVDVINTVVISRDGEFFICGLENSNINLYNLVE